MSIFSKLDIRGEYPQKIDETIAYRIGLRLGEMIKGDIAIIGSDIRENSQKLVNPLALGLEKSGKKVFFLEKVATEMVYYAVASRGLELGVQITASHNPWNETGFKIVGKNAVALGEDQGLKELQILLEKSHEEYTSQLPQNLEKINLDDEYANYSLTLIKDGAKLIGKLLIISFGEAGASLARHFFEKTQVETRIVVLDKEKLGDSPPNPMLLENQQLALKELDESFDLAVMLDGDSDRTIFIDPKKGRVLSGDLSGAIIAKLILGQKKGPIVFDIRKKMVMQKICKDYGVPLYQVISGYPFIKKKMMEVGAVFGGEVSGHYFYSNNNYSENSMLSTSLILAYLDYSQKSLSEALAEFEHKIFSIPEKNFEINKMPNFSWQNLKQRIGDSLPNAQVHFEDGIIAEGEDFYLSIRPSQNEPVIRLDLEAKNKEKLDLVYQQVKDLLEKG